LGSIVSAASLPPPVGNLLTPDLYSLSDVVMVLAKATTIALTGLMVVAAVAIDLL
jgi:hypothetical protein